MEIKIEFELYLKVHLSGNETGYLNFLLQSYKIRALIRMMHAPEIQSLISYRCELTAHIIESLSRAINLFIPQSLQSTSNIC